MSQKFEISRVEVGTVVLVLNREAAAGLAGTLGQVKDTGVKLTAADRGLVKKLGAEGDTIVLTLTDEQANRLCDLLEDGLTAELRYSPAVYAIGERLAHRIDPGCYFGPKQKAA